VQEVIRSPGQPLAGPHRANFETYLGTDLSGVSIHTDPRAAASADAIGADAYAVGRNLVFSRGAYAPDTTAGRRLLAHELAHVVQQHGTGSAPPQLEIGRTDDPVEREAELFADGVAALPAWSPAPIDGVGAAPITPQMGRQQAARMLRPHQPSIMLAPARRHMLRRTVRSGCFAPSEIVDELISSPFGTIAEAMVDADYLAQKGGRPFADVFLDNPLGPMSYIAFLKSHHPSLDTILLALQIGVSGGVLVPDILDTRPGSTAAPEFYDVKPDSVDGRALGRGKLASIDAFMSFNSLPYVRGDSYTPSALIPIPMTAVALATAIAGLVGPGTAILPMIAACGLPKVSLEVKRMSSGLLVYRVCVEADLDCYLKVIALEVLLAAVIAAVLLLGPEILPPVLAPPVPVLAATSASADSEGSATATTSASGPAQPGASGPAQPGVEGFT
jgi:hypothetical protein